MVNGTVLMVFILGYMSSFNLAEPNVKNHYKHHLDSAIFFNPIIRNERAVIMGDKNDTFRYGCSTVVNRCANGKTIQYTPLYPQCQLWSCSRIDSIIRRVMLNESLNLTDLKLLEQLSPIYVKPPRVGTEFLG